jgi:DNA-directed RNA polymerase beta' subunit
VGLADEIAWTIFGPQLIRELKDETAVRDRTQTAAEKLDEIMARSWVIVHRAPTTMPTSFQAFHPVRIADKVIRIHPLATRPMNGDFDGDQVAISLPITDAGQREAREMLSIEAHLRRDPSLMGWLVPLMESLWGLAELSLTSEGRNEINKLTTIEVEAPEGFITRETLTQAMVKLLERDGVEKTLAVSDRLTRWGFQLARESGASISPFIGESINRPAEPRQDAGLEAWDAYMKEMEEAIRSVDFSSNDLGPQVLAVRSGARGNLRQQLCRLIGGRGISGRMMGESVVVRHGLSQGLTPREMYLCAIQGRIALGQEGFDNMQFGMRFRLMELPTGYNLLSRAFRSTNPGIIFALAAAVGEIDPLTDPETRLFVGLPPK